MPHSTNFLEGNFAERKPQLLYTADLPRGLRLIPEFHRYLTRHKVQSGKREKGKGKREEGRRESLASAPLRCRRLSAPLAAGLQFAPGGTKTGLGKCLINLRLRTFRSTPEGKDKLGCASEIFK